MSTQVKYFSFPGCGESDCKFCKGEKLVNLTFEANADKLISLFRKLAMLANVVNSSNCYKDQSMVYFIRNSLENFFGHLKEGEIFCYGNLPLTCIQYTVAEKFGSRPMFVVYREHGYIETYIVKGE